MFELLRSSQNENQNTCSQSYSLAPAALRSFVLSQEAQLKAREATAEAEKQLAAAQETLAAARSAAAEAEEQLAEVAAEVKEARARVSFKCIPIATSLCLR